MKMIAICLKHPITTPIRHCGHVIKSLLHPARLFAEVTISASVLEGLRESLPMSYGIEPTVVTYLYLQFFLEPSRFQNLSPPHDNGHDRAYNFTGPLSSCLFCLPALQPIPGE